MYIYIHMCNFARCIYIYTYIPTHTHTYLYISIHIFILYIYLCFYRYMYLYTYVYARTHARVPLCSCTRCTCMTHEGTQKGKKRIRKIVYMGQKRMRKIVYMGHHQIDTDSRAVANRKSRYSLHINISVYRYEHTLCTHIFRYTDIFTFQVCHDSFTHCNHVYMEKRNEIWVKDNILDSHTHAVVHLRTYIYI